MTQSLSHYMGRDSAPGTKPRSITRKRRNYFKAILAFIRSTDSDAMARPRVWEQRVLSGATSARPSPLLLQHTFAAYSVARAAMPCIWTARRFAISSWCDHWRGAEQRSEHDTTLVAGPHHYGDGQPAATRLARQTADSTVMRIDTRLDGVDELKERISERVASGRRYETCRISPA